MNIQRLIERYEKFKASNKKMTSVDLVLKDLRSLDEPEKVKIPQFVAEHIKHAKEIGRDLQVAMNSSSIHEEVDEWLYTDNNMELFVRAWLDGYENEKEKEYLVKIKANNQYLMNNPDENAVFFYSRRAYARFTRKELEKAGFGWVFNCPGIELEEMEE